VLHRPADPRLKLFETSRGHEVDPPRSSKSGNPTDPVPSQTMFQGPKSPCRTICPGPPVPSSGTTSVLANRPDPWHLDGSPARLQQIVGHQPRLCEGQQVPTRKHVRLDAEPVTRDPALQAEGKETVVLTS
jgi:hypothetical protein